MFIKLVSLKEGELYFGLPGIAQPRYNFSWLSISLECKAKAALNSHFIWFAMYLETFVIDQLWSKDVNKFFQKSIPGPIKKYYS